MHWGLDLTWLPSPTWLLFYAFSKCYQNHLLIRADNRQRFLPLLLIFLWQHKRTPTVRSDVCRWLCGSYLVGTRFCKCFVPQTSHAQRQGQILVSSGQSWAQLSSALCSMGQAAAFAPKTGIAHRVLQASTSPWQCFRALLRYPYLHSLPSIDRVHHHHSRSVLP